MPAYRYFYDGPVDCDQTITLGVAESLHFKKVMRGKIDDQVELVNGRGILAFGKVTAVDKKTIDVFIAEVESAVESKPKLVLAQALPRPNRIDAILEKGTELGASAFLFFPGNRSEKKKLSDNQLERMRAVTIAAMKQCGRLFLPEITVKPPLKKWERCAGTLFFGDIQAEAPTLWSQLTDTLDSIYLVIGPESGFDDAELECLEQHGSGVSLNKNILRTDTAAIAGLAILSHYYGAR